jgi:CRP-like cAMP-binding protein
MPPSRRSSAPRPRSSPPGEAFLDLDDQPDAEAPPSDPDALRASVKDLLASNTKPDLVRARELLPHLLVDTERRGVALVWLAEIERRLGDARAGLPHLEAAARHFAERFEIPALERCAALAAAMMTEEAFASSLVHRLVEGARARVRPLDSLWATGPFAAVQAEHRGWIAAHADVLPLDADEILVREGAPARAVYVVKSGLLSVSIELAEGGERRVRYCHPGWVLGEMSALHHDRPTATATLRAEGPAEVWIVDADAIRRVMAQEPSLRQRLAATTHLNRLDRFFTTHDELGQLEVVERDELIHALAKVEVHDEPAIVMTAGETPTAALLVASGEVALQTDAGDATLEQALGADAFYGVRDAIHATPVPLTAVARAGSTLVWFDAEKLRALAASDPRVAAALERVG